MKQRRALVTGSGRGIGLAIARTLARKGNALFLLDRREDELRAAAAAIREEGGDAEVLVGDVTDPVFVKAAVTDAGPLDLVVNNAGVGGLGPFVSANPEKLWRVAEVNLCGTMLVTHAALAAMVRRGTGRIVNVASEAGTAGIAGSAIYSASKGAVILFTESVAREVEALGVRLFAVHPGGVLTPGSGAGLAPGSSMSPEMQAQVRDMLRDPPDLVANLICRIHDGSLDAISGSYISVNDDVEALISDGGQRLRLTCGPWREAGRAAR